MAKADLGCGLQICRSGIAVEYGRANGWQQPMVIRGLQDVVPVELEEITNFNTGATTALQQELKFGFRARGRTSLDL
jgi:hypothetical protein